MDPTLTQELKTFVLNNAPFQPIQKIQGRDVAYWKEAGVWDYLAFYSPSADRPIRFRWGMGRDGLMTTPRLAPMAFVPDEHDLGEIALWLVMANR